MPPRKSFISLSHKWFPHTQHQLQHHRVISFVRFGMWCIACASLALSRSRTVAELWGRWSVYSISISHFVCLDRRNGLHLDTEETECVSFWATERVQEMHLGKCASVCDAMRSERDVCADCDGARWGIARAAPYTHTRTQDNHIKIPFAEILSHITTILPSLHPIRSAINMNFTLASYTRENVCLSFFALPFHPASNKPMNGNLWNPRAHSHTSRPWTRT